MKCLRQPTSQGEKIYLASSLEGSSTGSGSSTGLTSIKGQGWQWQGVARGRVTRGQEAQREIYITTLLCQLPPKGTPSVPIYLPAGSTSSSFHHLPIGPPRRSKYRPLGVQDSISEPQQAVFFRKSHYTFFH